MKITAAPCACCLRVETSLKKTLVTTTRQFQGILLMDYCETPLPCANPGLSRFIRFDADTGLDEYSQFI